MAKKKTTEELPEVVEDVDLSGLVDTKLSRTEVIDLVIHDLMKELSKQIDVLEKPVRKYSEDDLEIDEIKRIKEFSFIHGDLSLDPYDSYYGEKKEKEPTFYAKVMVKIPLSKLPSSFKERYFEQKEREEKLADLNSQLFWLKNHRGQVKNELIKKSLESIPEGRDLLKKLVALREALKPQLKQARLPG